MKKFICGVPALLIALLLPLTASAHGGHPELPGFFHVLYHTLMDTKWLVISAIVSIVGVTMFLLSKKSEY